ncbi:MAG: hypothetical protein AB7T27_02030 [Kiritimatiellia bacterium]
MKYRKTLFVLGLLGLYLLGVGVRREVLEAQYEALGKSPSFTLESALHFRMIQNAMTGRLAKTDFDVEYPTGVNVRKTYSIGSEYFYALASKCWPSSVPLTERIRWLEVLWFCFGVPLMVLWIRWATGSSMAGWISGAFYAVAISSVIRSTGQEISRENFALPFLIAHLAFQARAAGDAPRSRLWAVLSAACLALAAINWDLIQFYVFLWAVVGAVRLRRADFQSRSGLRNLWLAEWAALVLASLINPYLRAHGWIFSPPMLLACGVTAGLCMELKSGVRLSGRNYALILAVPVLLGLLIHLFLAESYSHFGGLLWAKLRFLNRKPADPSLLTFDQRIMWVPALHSTTLSLAKTMFPALLVLTIPAFFVLCFYQFRCARSEGYQFIFFYGASLITFWFFFRFHVYLAVFAAAIPGALCGALKERHPMLKWVLFLLAACCWAVEARHTLSEPGQWGRTNVYYRELDELTDWFAKNGGQKPVAANFGVSASLLAYGGSPIVLHPKFEGREIRRRVREYGETLFKGDEAEFRKWAGKYGAEWYVHALGEFSSHSPDLQMRYFADALMPPENAVARMFEFRPEEGNWFRFRWGNRKYRVFEIVSEDDERMAIRSAGRAQEELQNGNLDNAEYYAVEALKADDRNTAAMKVLLHVGELLKQDFKGEQL